MTRRNRQRALLLNRIQTRSERRWARELRSLYRRMITLVVAAFSPDDVRPHFRTQMERLLRRLYMITAVASRDQMYTQLNQLQGKNAIDIFELAAIAWIERHVAEKVTTLEESFFGSVRDVVEEAFTEGLSEADTARRIRNKVGRDFSQWKAARIARTEAAAASNMGTHEAARSADVETVKEWFSAEDSRVRPDHAAVHGQIREMEEPFNVVDSSLMYPGDPSGPPGQIINCRCVALYHPRINGEIVR